MSSPLRGGRVVAVGLPVVVGLLVVAFRVLSAVDLDNDHYMTMGWAQQVLFGAWPERDFVEPGMPLSYLFSAAVQARWPGPFSEVVLTSAFMGVAAGATVWAAARLSASWIVGLVAAAVSVAFYPRLYSFPKALTPAVTVVLIDAYARSRSARVLTWLGAWLAVSALFRHDLGVYATGAALTGLVAVHWADGRSWLRAVGRVVGGGSIVGVPYLAYVSWAVGIGEHIRRGVEFSKGEAHQLFSGLPPWSDVGRFDKDGAIAFLFFAAYALVPVTVALLVVRRARHDRALRAVAVSSVTALVLFLPVILRHPVANRLSDLSTVYALGLAWIVGQGLDTLTCRWRAGAWAMVGAAGLALAVGLAGASGAAAWRLTSIDERLDNMGVHAGWRGLRENWDEARKRGTSWPWTRSWPSGVMPPAVLYLNACTTPRDAVVLDWPAPEVAFFARRRFAAGHVEFLPPSAFATPADQQQMLGFLAGESVPVMLSNVDRHEEFARTYPRVAAFLAERYTAFGTFKWYDGSTIQVLMRRGSQPSGTWGDERWPCGFTPGASRPARTTS